MKFILVDFIVLLTGNTGSGKSQACNFFMKEDVFSSEWSLKPVATASCSCTRAVEGKCLQIIEAPGFLNPCSLSSTGEFDQLARAIIDMPNGVHAVGLVINIASRITKEDAKLLETLLTMEEMIPYVFIIFTHAIVLGTSDKEQQETFKKMVNDSKSCPEILQNLLKNINNQYMLLESVEPMEQEYHRNKSLELFQILQKIKETNISLFTCTLNEIAQNIENFGDKNKEKVIEALSKYLQGMDLELKKEQDKKDANLHWKKFLFYTAGMGAGVGIAGMLFSSTISAGICEIYKFLSKNSKIFSREVFKQFQ